MTTLFINLYLQNRKGNFNYFLRIIFAVIRKIIVNLAVNGGWQNV